MLQFKAFFVCVQKSAKNTDENFGGEVMVEDVSTATKLITTLDKRWDLWTNKEVCYV